MLSDARDRRIYLRGDPPIGGWLEIGPSLSFLERHDLAPALDRSQEDSRRPAARGVSSITSIRAGTAASAKAARRSTVTLPFLRWARSRRAAWAGAVSGRRPSPYRAGAASSERACAGAPAPRPPVPCTPRSSASRGKQRGPRYLSPSGRAAA